MARKRYGTKDMEIQILAYVRANPRVTIRHVSKKINVSYGAVQQIKKKNIRYTLLDQI